MRESYVDGCQRARYVRHPPPHAVKGNPARPPQTCATHQTTTTPLHTPRAGFACLSALLSASARGYGRDLRSAAAAFARWYTPSSCPLPFLRAIAPSMAACALSRVPSLFARMLHIVSHYPARREAASRGQAFFPLRTCTCGSAASLFALRLAALKVSQCQLMPPPPHALRLQLTSAVFIAGMNVLHPLPGMLVARTIAECRQLTYSTAPGVHA